MSLDMLRSSVEEKDLAIITLIAERMNIVHDIAKEKERQGLPVRIPDQANAVLDRATAESEKLDLDPEPVREIFQILVRMSEEFQEQWRKKKE
ncbi:chorismate mutase [Methanospirillum sp.]|uniref:chorismate mutase n=1 Tax=Methanospirillum sp. TaxID=45200 RepID=UPI002983267E|nr:chorismate mutase [Methanospirillum sp.]